MIIKFSRHASRRAKLYKIPKELITGSLEKTFPVPGKNEIVFNTKSFLHPIKIVFDFNGSEVFIITNYPLKKGRSDENIL